MRGLQRETGGYAVMKLLVVVLGSLFLAGITLAGVSVLDPSVADAANGVRVKTCTGSTIQLRAEEKRMLDLHNQKRGRNLCVHPNLQKAARAHSASMARSNKMSHGNVGKRLKRHGYRWSAYGENVAYNPGAPKAASIFRQWMNSSGHRANIRSRKFREVGIGTANGRGKTWWTVDFGSRR